LYLTAKAFDTESAGAKVFAAEKVFD